MHGLPCSCVCTINTYLIVFREPDVKVTLKSDSESEDVDGNLANPPILRISEMLLAYYNNDKCLKLALEGYTIVFFLGGYSKTGHIDKIPNVLQ